MSYQLAPQHTLLESFNKLEVFQKTVQWSLQDDAPRSLLLDARTRGSMFGDL